MRRLNRLYYMSIFASTIIFILGLIEAVSAGEMAILNFLVILMFATKASVIR